MLSNDKAQNYHFRRLYTTIHFLIFAHWGFLFCFWELLGREREKNNKFERYIISMETDDGGCFGVNVRHLMCSNNERTECSANKGSFGGDVERMLNNLKI